MHQVHLDKQTHTAVLAVEKDQSEMCYLAFLTHTHTHIGTCVCIYARTLFDTTIIATCFLHSHPTDAACCVYINVDTTRKMCFSTFSVRLIDIKRCISVVTLAAGGLVGLVAGTTQIVSTTCESTQALCHCVSVRQ